MSKVDRKLIFEASEAVYASAFDPKGWSDLLDILKVAIPELRTGLQFRDPNFNIQQRNLIRGYDTDFVKSYMMHFRGVDESTPILKAAPVGKVFKQTDVNRHTEFFGREFYHDWIRPQDDISNAFGVVLSRTDAGTLFMACHLPAGLKEDVVDTSFATLAELAPLMVRAARLSHWVAADAVRAEPANLVIDHLATAVFCLDRTGRVMSANPSAERLLQAGTVIRSFADGRLRFCDATAEATFHQVRTMSLRSDSPMGHQGFAAPDTRRGIQMAATVLPNPARSRDGFTFGTQADATTILLITDPSSAPIPPSSMLRSVYGLTKAEALVAERLAMGDALPEIAEICNVKQSTVRSQIKAIMEKMDASRQSEIVRLVLGLAGGFSLHSGPVDGPGQARPPEAGVRTTWRR